MNIYKHAVLRDGTMLVGFESKDSKSTAEEIIEVTECMLSMIDENGNPCDHCRHQWERWVSEGCLIIDDVEWKRLVEAAEVS